jgi:phage-related baseplate assembly protein
VTAVNLLIGFLVLGLVIFRQLIRRRVRSNRRIVLILAVQDATILLYLAVTFSVQRLLIQAREERAAVPAQVGPTSFA